MKRIKKVALISFLVIGIGTSVAYKSDFFEIAKQLEIYTTLFKELNMYYIDEINPAKINQEGINQMLNSLDPYTRFYDEQGVANARINAAGQNASTGAIANFKSGKLIVTSVSKGSPAAKATVFIGDEILSINNIIVDATQKETTLSQLRGLPKTNISLKIKRQDKVIDKEISLTAITESPVPVFKMLENNIGYIALSRFNDKAFDEIESAFLDMKEKGMTSLILDLRGNPGGLLGEAVDITGLFIPKGEIVVTTKAKIKKWSNTYRSLKEPLDLEIPLVVLVNGRSASASEIVSGALQDLDRAVIVGSRSYGKGLVQRYRKLTYGAQLKLTISKYYTPSGRNIQELDYTNRVGDNIPKFSDKKRPQFKTVNGRLIYGGGGVTPDIVVADATLTETTKTLLASDAVFDFSTDYYYKHQAIDSINSFVLKQNDFQDFISFTKSNGVFVSPVEESFKKSKDMALKADLDVSKLYQKVSDKIRQEQQNQLQKDKNKITDMLAQEIIRRYYFEEGLYQYKLQNDATLNQAIIILKDKNKYQDILH